MSHPWNAWFALSAQAARMCWEAQAVMLLRGLRMAQGGAKAKAEAQRMITEKVAALTDSGRSDGGNPQRQQETSCCEESVWRLHEAGQAQQTQAIEVSPRQPAVRREAEEDWAK